MVMAIDRMSIESLFVHFIIYTIYVEHFYIMLKT